MTDYSIDLDLIKEILKCKGVNRVDYRLSASGRGFHFLWMCSRKHCKHCSEIEKSLDDPRRYAHDLQRPKPHRRILWEYKAGRKAGPWKSVIKEKQVNG